MVRRYSIKGRRKTTKKSRGTSTSWTRPRTRGAAMIKVVRSPGGYYGTVHKFAQKCQLGPLSIPSNSSTGYVGAQQTFRFNDLPQASSFGQLFDQYSIDKVHWMIVHRSTGASIYEVANNGGQGMPSICLAKDFDDTTVPASTAAGWSDIEQYTKAKFFDFDTGKRKFKTSIRPAIAMPAYETAITTAYTPAWGKKIDMQYNDVPHYGLRYVVKVPFTAANTVATEYFDIYATYEISLYNVR